MMECDLYLIHLILDLHFHVLPRLSPEVVELVYCSFSLYLEASASKSKLDSPF
jgi:hypothetical protein